MPPFPPSAVRVVALPRYYGLRSGQGLRKKDWSRLVGTLFLPRFVAVPLSMSSMPSLAFFTSLCFAFAPSALGPNLVLLSFHERNVSAAPSCLISRKTACLMRDPLCQTRLPRVKSCSFLLLFSNFFLLSPYCFFLFLFFFLFPVKKYLLRVIHSPPCFLHVRFFFFFLHLQDSRLHYHLATSSRLVIVHSSSPFSISRPLNTCLNICLHQCQRMHITKLGFFFINVYSAHNCSKAHPTFCYNHTPR